MPPSQLKRLKSSLREQGITGPQRSKKQKKAAAKDRSGGGRVGRNVALQQIRDSFNPFELRQAARPVKFESVSRDSVSASRTRYKDVLHRPGVSKSVGEEMRRKELLPELQRRNKTGGLVDRRIGEGNSSLSLEEKALQRFSREKAGKTSLFDLEASDGDDNEYNTKVSLTHLGQRLDDFSEEDIGGDETGSATSDHQDLVRRKRPLTNEDGPADLASEDQPERKKSKKEVMEEVIAKSKLHKYERQKAKEDDEDLREELDQGLDEVLALLQGHAPRSHLGSKAQDPPSNTDGPVINPERLKLMDSLAGIKTDKEYDIRLRQLAQDTRAKPAERTLTEEEKATSQAKRLKELDMERKKRMIGEAVPDDEDDTSDVSRKQDIDETSDSDISNEAADFGFAQPGGLQRQHDVATAFDDEDDFAIDEDLIDSGPDLDTDADSSEISGVTDDTADIEKDDLDFGRSLFVDGDPTSANLMPLGQKDMVVNEGNTRYSCPASHPELLEILDGVTVDRVHVIVQRIRALYQPSLSAGNKQALAVFSSILVDHLVWMAEQKQSLLAIEQIIRHVQSLSRTFPLEIAEAFRGHLREFHLRGHPLAGDLVLLMAITTIYPTSDHFHQVVTPAITLIGKWLGLSGPETKDNSARGAYMIAILAGSQKLSKRFVPEAIRFTLKTLNDAHGTHGIDVERHANNILILADLWKEKGAFAEIFTPALSTLQQLDRNEEFKHLKNLLLQARQRRRPLQLQHHRAQAIRTSVPKFEDDFNPDKHYDPDKERSDAKKLQKEYNRERKGALRELRKDANFIAREQLREKRVRDAEYEKKQRRLIAEIQGEEGHEAKSYEREKRRRKAAK